MKKLLLMVFVLLGASQAAAVMPQCGLGQPVSCNHLGQDCICLPSVSQMTCLQCLTANKTLIEEGYDARVECYPSCNNSNKMTCGQCQTGNNVLRASGSDLVIDCSPSCNNNL